MRVFRGSRMGRVATALAGAFLALTAHAGTAMASPDTGSFAAQAKGAGLSNAQAEKLQEKVDFYLERMGGTQVAINKVDLNGAGAVVIPLPGQDRAHEVSASGKASALYTCAYGHFCAYSDTYYKGSVIDMYYCQHYNMPWSGPGSWDNNQTTGTRARMEDRYHVTTYTTPGARSWDPTGNWTNPWYVVPC